MALARAVRHGCCPGARSTTARTRETTPPERSPSRAPSGYRVRVGWAGQQFLCVAVLMACRAGPHATEGAEAGHAARAPARAPGDTPTIVADRGVSHGTRGVRVETRWRSEVDPRGVIVVFSPRDATYADLANRVLAEGFNHSFVESTNAPLAARVEFAATIANDKSLGGRQWLERAELRQPTITVLWFDAGEREAARTLLREHPPFRVAAAILVGGTGLSSRDAIALEGGGEIRVLEAQGPVNDALWAEVREFLAEVERDLGLR